MTYCWLPNWLKKAIVKLLAQIWRIGQTDRWMTIPNIFSETMLKVPETLPIESLQEVQFDGKMGPKVVIIASRVKYSPDEVGKPLLGRKLFQEVFFTDVMTGSQLAGWELSLNGESTSYQLLKIALMSKLVLMFFMLPAPLYRGFITSTQFVSTETNYITSVMDLGSG